MANKIVFVCGSPGAGKSTIVNSIAKDRKYKVLNMGTLMMDIALSKKYVKDRDELRFMSRERVNELQILTFQRISKMNGNIILDTHATVEENGRYLPGFAVSHINHLKRLVGFVYIDSLTSDIAKRRKSDRTRRRENERLDFIDVQREINLSILSTCSTYFDMPLYVVFNEQGKLRESIKQTKSHLKDIFGA
ncbi:MAG: AAA family ATPase [Candidatus Micrarchaeota archaeon]|nr:AAA family ATPase [Candidatus Micrarchaeota archaeon]